ncbi:MAG: hypothetical protein IH848_07675 [Acidobacteria bacterium]|nr:hypothetical protein [Acidobacteriota bacterium]
MCRSIPALPSKTSVSESLRGRVVMAPPFYRRRAARIFIRLLARISAAPPRVPRVDGAQKAPTGRARCRSCREPIEKDSWRVSLVFYEDGRYQPSGFVHAACVSEYFETTAILRPARHFSAGLSDEQAVEFQAALS